MEQILYASLILLAFGVSLRMSLRLLYGARGPQVGDPIHQVVNAGSWALTIIPLAVFIVAGTTWLSWFVLAIAAFSGLELILARREMQRRSAWDLITESLGSPQPASQTWHEHEGRFTGIVGRSFRSLVASLARGTDLKTAIGRHRRALPEEAQAYAAIDAISIADQSLGNGGRSIQQTRTVDSKLNATGQQLYQRFTYLSTVLVVMLGVLTFLILKIVPSYQAIFDDFELQLPNVTVLLISICNTFAVGAAATILSLVIGALLLYGLITGILYLCDIHVLRPITDRLFFSKHRTLVLRLFAIAAQRGQSFQTLLQQLAEGETRYPSRYTVRRLRVVNKLIASGAEWKQALQAMSFLKRADIPMLETAQQAGNLPWVLNLLADKKTRSMLFRWAALERIVFPLVVVLIGLVVLFICVALFLPLVELINGLT